MAPAQSIRYTHELAELDPATTDEYRAVLADRDEAGQIRPVTTASDSLLGTGSLVGDGLPTGDGILPGGSLLGA